MELFNDDPFNSTLARIEVDRGYNCVAQEVDTQRSTKHKFGISLLSSCPACELDHGIKQLHIIGCNRMG